MVLLENIVILLKNIDWKRGKGKVVFQVFGAFILFSDIQDFPMVYTGKYH